MKGVANAKNGYESRQGSQNGIQSFISKKINIVLKKKKKKKSGSISFPLIWMATKIDSTKIHEAS